MNQVIKIICKGREYDIPNSWAAVAPPAWRHFVENYQKVEHGRLSVGELHIRLLCDLMGWQLHKMKGDDTMETLVVLSEQLTFPFKIAYSAPEGAADPLSALTDDQYAIAVRHEPDNIDQPWAEPLRRQAWHYQPDLCFFKQMQPMLTLDRVVFEGYRADFHHGAISTSLTALQYIDASDALQQDDKAMLAAILYTPEPYKPYNSTQAHALAEDFAHLDPVLLDAVALNFVAINNFLYTKTPFSLLAKFEHAKSGSRTGKIATTMADALYDLTKDGLGNASEVEQLNLLTYLRILRKQTIDTVRQLHGMQMDVAKIANETGLPPAVIAKIV